MWLAKRFKPGLLALAVISGASLFGALPVTRALAAPLDFPPIWDLPNPEHHVGKVVWRELVTPDLRGAQDFYGAMFGWTFHNADGMPLNTGAVPSYAIAMLDGQPVAGLVNRRAPSNGPVQPAWLNFFSVRDVDTAQHLAIERGAKVLVEPRDYGRRGRQAILADPQGAVFAVLASRGGDGPDELAAAGDWIWISLLARDADKDAAFYQSLFDYEVYELPSPDGREHVVLASEDLARASVNDMPDDSPGRHAHWLAFVRVLDVAMMASRARELGGRVLVAPHSDRHGGQVAVIADPQGALLGLMDWDGTEAQGSTK